MKYLILYRSSMGNRKGTESNNVFKIQLKLNGDPFQLPVVASVPFD